MNCPNCSAALQETDYRGVRIDECAACHGRWFDRDELRRAKDRADDDLRWLDFDPFARDAESGAEASDGRVCPKCSLAMGVIPYATSGVVIDKCKTCHGIWLNHDEFEKIVAHLEDTLLSETSSQYLRDAEKQFAQIVTGHEGVVAEARDFLTVTRLLEMRLSVEHPKIVNAILRLYLASPIK